MEVSINKNNEINNINFSNKEFRNRSLKNWNSPITKKLFLKLKEVLFNSKGEVLARIEAEPHVKNYFNKETPKIIKELFIFEDNELDEDIKNMLNLINFKKYGKNSPDFLDILKQDPTVLERTLVL